MRRITTTLALALSLLGCSVPTGERIELLTPDGINGCYAGGERPVEGMLVADKKYGTRFGGLPVIWPHGFSGVRLLGGEVAVLDDAGKHIATTGKEYGIAPFPFSDEAKRQLVGSVEAYAAAANCGYAWDFYEVK